MQKALSVLGSTGSIGQQTLETAQLLGVDIRAISANSNIALLESQARKFKPSVVSVYDESAALDLKVRLQDMQIKVVGGADGLIEAACVDSADTVVTAVVGKVGLRPTLAAIKQKRRIALANKETLVCAGEIIMSEARKHSAEIIPVDSELSAVFQCLNSESRADIKNIILTASGGPFRGKTKNELLNVTPEMAVAHPNWNMGKKISVDSATLINKGFEAIEAVHLFSVSPENVEVVVHPESIIHSMVEFSDNSILAQLSLPDMRLPIQYALTYPMRFPSLTKKLDLAKLGQLTFENPDLGTFPCLKLALDAVKKGGTSCAVLNGANETAVSLFLQGKLSFYGIYESVHKALEHVKFIENPTLDELDEADTTAREFVYSLSF